MGLQWKEVEIQVSCPLIFLSFPYLLHQKVLRSLPVASQLKHLLSCRRKRLDWAKWKAVWRKRCRKTAEQVEENDAGKLQNRGKKKCRCNKKGEFVVRFLVFCLVGFFTAIFFPYLLIFPFTPHNNSFWTMFLEHSDLPAVILVPKAETVSWQYTKLCGWIHTQIFFFFCSEFNAFETFWFLSHLST